VIGVPLEELVLIGASMRTFAETLATAVPIGPAAELEQIGTHHRFD
jgi:hypothetical protein